MYPAISQNQRVAGLHSLLNPEITCLLLAALLAIVLLPATAFAQLTRGAVSGTVRDAVGAVVVGATVRITNLDTNQTRTTTTNGAGMYRVTALEPGPYSVMIEESGFASVENRAIVVRTSEEVTFDAALTVATTNDVIDVSAQTEALSLNKTNPTVGLTSTGRQAVELPLSPARNINNLALLSPNVFLAPGSSQISANGQRARNNNFTIDGSDNNDIAITVATTQIIPEEVAQFQIQTNPFNAEFGRNSGAQINVITKSGTNRWHGDAFEYYRGSALNALDNIEKNNGLTEPARFNRNQFGGTIGGPIIKDRTFVFGSFQGDLIRAAGVVGLPDQTIRIPTPAGFAALSDVPLRPGQSQASRQAVLNSLGFLNDVFALNPVFTNIQNVTVNDVAIETGNTNIPLNQPTNSWHFTIRGDHKFREGDNLTIRYTYDRPVTSNLVSNIQFGPRFAGDQQVLDQNTALSETHVFTPNLLNEFRFSFVRRDLQFPENDLTTPTTTIAGGFFTIGGLNTFPQGRVQNSYQWSDILSWQVGRHALKFGADIRHIQLVNTSGFDSKGTFTFNNLQDFLNNTAVTFVQALQTASFAARQTQQFYFAQDDFRIKPNLTLNLGLRYENSSVPLGFFGATDAQVRAALVPGPVERDNDNFAPRIGFAYSPGGGRTVIRGGYGISYDILFFNLLVVNANNFPRVVVGRQDNAIDVFPNLAPVTGAPVFNPLATFVNTPEQARTPYAQFYSLSVQREFSRDFLVEVGYTGSRGVNLINQLQANPAVLTPEQAATVRATGSTISIPSVQARRVFPQFGSRILIATEAQSTYNAGYVSVNKRLSHGLQVGASYTYSKNISDNDESLAVPDIIAGSPQIPQDFFNRRAERGVSAFDRTHRFVVNYLYEVPWFKAGWAQLPVIRQVFSGWQISGITSAQSGQPFTILTGVDSNGNGAGGDRPNFDPNGTLARDPVTENLRTFTTSGRFLVPRGSNGLPLAFSLGNGNLGRNTLRGPGFSNWDISIAKSFTLHETHKLVFRVDFFNAFNQDTYGNPVNNLNSPDFGRNLNNFGNRSITLGARYTF